jgi:hypothetical protein
MYRLVYEPEDKWREVGDNDSGLLEYIREVWMEEVGKPGKALVYFVFQVGILPEAL